MRNRRSTPSSRGRSSFPGARAQRRGIVAQGNPVVRVPCVCVRATVRIRGRITHARTRPRAAIQLSSTFRRRQSARSCAIVAIMSSVCTLRTGLLAAVLVLVAPSLSCAKAASDDSESGGGGVAAGGQGENAGEGGDGGGAGAPAGGGNGASGGAGGSSDGGDAGAGASAGSGGTSSGGNGSAGAGGTTSDGGFGGSGGTDADAGVPCGSVMCRDWKCVRGALTMSAWGCCIDSGTCGASTTQGSSVCLPVDAVEQLLQATCTQK